MYSEWNRQCLSYVFMEYRLLLRERHLGLISIWYCDISVLWLYSKGSPVWFPTGQQSLKSTMVVPNLVNCCSGWPFVFIKCSKQVAVLFDEMKWTLGKETIPVAALLQISCLAWGKAHGLCRLCDYGSFLLIFKCKIKTPSCK